jgi:uncharacterized DUF497 family protein
VHFGDAVAALEDERAVTIRDSWSDEEERWITLRQDGLGRLLVVVYSWPDENVLLISARLATHRERRVYTENL